MILRKRPAPIFKYIFFFLGFAFSTTAYSQRILFTGTIYDFDTHQPIAGVTVKIKDKKITTVTDSLGVFKFSLPVDAYTLIISSSGYITVNLDIYILDKDNAVVYLKKAPPNELQEVTVETRKKDAAVKSMQMSTIRINPAQLKKTPLIFGEADIIRALTLQPGIITSGETVSSYNVRGGASDQNLILIDGAPMFNISHLLGFYSGISADAVQDLTFYKAGIPAEWGSRLSSIMLLNVKTGNPDSLRFNTGAGFVSSHFFVNGPIVKKKLTVMAGGRIAYPKLMMNLFPGDIAKSDAFYYDGIIKVSYMPDINNRVNITWYNSYDRYRFPGDTSYSWKNNIGSIQWKSNFSSKFSMTLLGDYSKYVSNINGLDKSYSYLLSSSIQQKEAKLSFNYNIAEEQKINVGAGFVHYTIEPGKLAPSGDSSLIVNKILPAENASEFSAFAGTENKINKFLELQLGVRFTQYNYLGPRYVYSYESGKPLSSETVIDSMFYGANKTIKSFNGFEPRVLLRILFDKSTSLKLSYNKTRQYLHLITNTISVTPVDYWKLSDGFITPQTADQYAAGIFKNFSDNNFETSIEGYYKEINNSVDYKNGASLSLNPTLETELLPSKGYAYGAEFSVRKNTGILTGTASYTYSRTFTKVVTPFATEQVNDGTYFPANADRPHNFVLTTSVKLGKGWLFSSNFVYTSGRVATFPDGSYIINGTIVIDYSKRNADRLPAYHRLDIAFSHDNRRYSQQRKYSVLNFSFYNVYARQNIYSIYFVRNADQIKSYRLSVLGSIVPSISWNYNF